jgi:PTS system fructose-specific IIB component
MKIVAVTACSGGIAHTYMAAEAIKKSAKKAGDEVNVEIQGSMGLENRLKQSEIDEADFVIFAVNISVREKDRFKRKKIIEVDPGKFVGNPDKALMSAKEKGGFLKPD